MIFESDVTVFCRGNTNEEMDQYLTLKQVIVKRWIEQLGEFMASDEPKYPEIRHPVPAKESAALTSAIAALTRMDSL